MSTNPAVQSLVTHQLIPTINAATPQATVGAITVYNSQPANLAKAILVEYDTLFAEVAKNQGVANPSRFQPALSRDILFCSILTTVVGLCILNRWTPVFGAIYSVLKVLGEIDFNKRMGELHPAMSYFFEERFRQIHHERSFSFSEAFSLPNGEEFDSYALISHAALIIITTSILFNHVYKNNNSILYPLNFDRYITVSTSTLDQAICRVLVDIFKKIPNASSEKANLRQFASILNACSVKLLTLDTRLPLQMMMNVRLSHITNLINDRIARL